MIKNAEPGNIIAIDEIWLMINGKKTKSPSVVYQVTN